MHRPVDLGYMYYSGEGVVKDFGEAVRLYTLATDQGQIDAQTSLGYMYYSGEGVAQDLREAARLFRLAADQGNAS